MFNCVKWVQMMMPPFMLLLMWLQMVQRHRNDKHSGVSWWTDIESTNWWWITRSLYTRISSTNVKTTIKEGIGWNSHKLTADAILLKRLLIISSGGPVQPRKYAHLCNLNYADPSFNVHKNVGIILGTIENENNQTGLNRVWWCEWTNSAGRRIRLDNFE